MNQFGYGFVKGFFGTLGEESLRRQQDAEEYFNKQVDLARTRGLQNKGKVRQAIDQSVSLASQLQQMGVPKNIIMSVANQNPAELADFYDTVSRAAAAGAPMTEEFFNDVIQVGGDFKAPDEDFNTFFSRIYEPVAANYKADPEGFERDRKGSLLKTFLGYNAMDGARDRLGRTVVADGMTAEQLLAYGDDALPGKPYGNSVVTYRHDRLKARTDSGKGLGGADIDRLRKAFDEELGQYRLELANNPEGEEPPLEVQRQEAARRLYTKFARVPEYRSGIEDVTGYSYEELFGEEETGDEITEQVLPPSADELADAGIGTGEASATPAPSTDSGPVAPPTGAPTEGDRSPINITKEPQLMVLPINGVPYRFIESLPNGQAVYENENTGETVRLDSAQVRKLVYRK